MLRTCLIAVDVQADFLPGGALAVPDGDSIIKPLIEVADSVDLVVASRDWHPKDHPSFHQWGPHCVQKTPGARIHPQIRKRAKYTISKGTGASDAYSAFAGHTLRPVRYLKDILKEEGIEKVIVGGLAFDVCVKWTALDANAIGLGPMLGKDSVIVPMNCTRPLEGEIETLNVLRRAGVVIMEEWTQ